MMHAPRHHSETDAAAAIRRIAAALAAVLMLAGAAADAARLAPHKAAYTMNRKSTTIDSDVVGVKGRMEMSVEVSCDGWRFEQYLGFRIVGTDESVLEHVAYLSGFETADGREYWFNTRTYEDRELVEELSGVARREDEDAAGEVRLAKPSPLRLELPPGTRFPTAHIEALVEAARAGERQMLQTVYDGSTLESPYEIAAIIGRSHRGGLDGFPALDESEAWPMRLAYYAVPAIEPTPDFEMNILLFDNGVAGDMVYDYGNFSVAVELDRLEMLPTPDCG